MSLQMHVKLQLSLKPPRCTILFFNGYLAMAIFRVDVVALQAHQIAITDNLYLCTPELRHLLKEAYVRPRRTTWFAGKSRSNLLFHLHPFLRLIILRTIPRSLKRPTHRLRVGTAHTKYLLHKSGKVRSPCCLWGHPDKPIVHLVSECLRNDAAQRRFKGSLCF